MKDRIAILFNSWLKALNVLLLIALGFTAYRLYTVSKQPEPVSFTEEREKIFILNDTITGKLDSKQAEIVSLSPLRLKLHPEGVCVQKGGEWIKVEKGKYIVIINPYTLMFIDGIKHEQLNQVDF